MFPSKTVHAEFRYALAIVVFAVVAVLLGAVDATGQNRTDDFEPFAGVVTGDNVYVRAGPSQQYYHVMQLDRGAIVRVRENLHGWYEIDVPEGSFSWISQKYVEPSADGGTGSVTGNNVRVRAPSPKGPGRENSYKSQTTLDTGDEVTILGQAPGWYKIVPPDEASLFIHSDYVDRATGAQIRAQQQEQAAAQPPSEAEASGTDRPATTETQPAAEPAEPADETASPTGAASTEPADTDARAGMAEDAADENGVGSGPAQTAAETTSATETAEAAEAPADEGEPAAADTATATATGVEADAEPEPEEAGIADRAVDESLAALEQRFAEASRKPLIDQPVSTLLADYQRLLERQTLTEQQRAIATVRVELLRTRLDLKQTLVELKQTQTELQAERTDEAGDADAGEAAPAQTQRRTDAYTAVGRLLASSLYTGERLPRLYRLVDPLSDMTIGYVEPSEQPNVRRMLGRVVGIIGTSRYHPGLKLKIISVDEIDPLAAQR